MIPSSNNVFVFDGFNVLYRSVYATGTGGDPCFNEECSSHFLKLVNNIVFRFSAERCFVVWDGGRSERREKIFEDYKSSREEDRSVRTRAIMKMRSLSKILSLLGCKVVCLPGKEADDVIYKVVSMIGGGVVVSSDEDMLQLSRKGVSVYLHNKAQFISPVFFRENVGIDPDYYLLAKSMAGDSSDSIPGIHGIGMKTACSLIEKAKSSYGMDFQYPDELLKALNSIPPKDRGKREKWVLSSPDTIRRNWELMDLSKERFSPEEMSQIRSIAKKRSVTHMQEAMEALEEEGCLDLVGPYFHIWSVPFRKLI